MKIPEMITLIGLVFGILGGSYAAINVFATNEDLRLVEDRLDHKILTDRLHALEERLWTYEEKYGEGCQQCSAETKEVYNRIKQEMRDIERELKKLGKLKS